MNRRDAETQRGNEFTEKIIGACIEIHKALGPGLLESAYEECLCFELSKNGLKFERQKPLPVVYKSVRLDCGYRLDLVVEDSVIVELKAIESLLQVRGLHLGLLINFNVPVLKQGVKRIVNNFPEPSSPSASPRLCG